MKNKLHTRLLVSRRTCIVSLARRTLNFNCQKASIKIFDCNGGKELPKRTLKLMSALLQTQENQFSVEFVDVPLQVGSHDCGLFALAYIASICNGQDPAVLLHKQNAMRKHILKSIEDGVMTMYWAVVSLMSALYNIISYFLY